jgi:hypothetical protein
MKFDIILKCLKENYSQRNKGFNFNGSLEIKEYNCAAIVTVNFTFQGQKRGSNEVFKKGEKEVFANK